MKNRLIWIIISLLVCVVACGVVDVCVNQEFNMTKLCLPTLSFFGVLLLYDCEYWCNRSSNRKTSLSKSSTSDQLDLGITSSTEEVLLPDGIFENELPLSQSTLMLEWNESVREHDYHGAEKGVQIKTNGTCKDTLVGQYSDISIDLRGLQSGVDIHVYHLFKSNSLPALHLSSPVKKTTNILDHCNDKKQTVKNSNKNREKVNVIGFGNLAQSRVPTYKKLNAQGLNNLVGQDLVMDEGCNGFNNDSTLLTQHENPSYNIDGEVSAGLGSFLAEVGDGIDREYSTYNRLVRNLQSGRGVLALSCVSVLLVGAIVIKKRLD